MRAALDTNVLAYAEGVNGVSMRAKALDLLRNVSKQTPVLPVQALGELFHLLVRKAGHSRMSARTVILTWQRAFPVVGTSASVIAAATDLATDHELVIWDAIIVAAAAEVGCRLLLSEDFQNGFTWRGVTIVNPFAKARHPLLQQLLSGSYE